MARRTEVTVDILIGRVTYNGGPVRIPAEIGGPGGGGTGGGGGGGPTGQGGLSPMANLFGVFNMFGIRRQLLSLQNLIPGIGGAAEGAAAASTAALGAIAAILAVVVIGWKVMQAQIAIVRWGLERVGEIGATVLKAVWELTKGCVTGFIELGKAALEGTLVAIQAFGEAALQALQVAGEAIVRFTQEAVAAFAELEQAAANVATVMGKFGPASLGARADAMAFAMDMASSMRYAASEVAGAMYEAYSAGFATTEQIKALTRASLDLASATLSAVQPTMEMLAATLNTYSIAAENASRVSDIFVNAANKTPATIAKLTESMKYAGPMAATFGISLKETVATLDAFYYRGISGSMAGTLFRQMINGLTRVSDKASAQFKKLGVDLATFSPLLYGSIVPVIRKFEELEARIGKMKVRELIMKAFEMRAANALIVALDTGSAGLERLQWQLNDTGTAAQAAQDQLNTLAGAWQLLKNVWQNFEIMVVRGAFATAIRWVVQALSDMVKMAERMGLIGRIGDVLARVTYLVYGLLKVLGAPLLAALDQILVQFPAVINAVWASMSAVFPSIIGYIMWLPKLFEAAFGKIIPAVLRFGEAFVPLMIQIATIVLPMLIDVVTQFTQFFTAFLTTNRESVVKWFSDFAWGVEQMLGLLPSVAPMLQSMVDMFMLWGPYLISVAVYAMPLLIGAMQQLLPVLMQLGSQGLTLLVMSFIWLVLNLPKVVGLFFQLASIAFWFIGMIQMYWPTISGLIAWGMGIASKGLEGFGAMIAWLEPIVRKILVFIRDHWGAIINGAAEFVYFLIGAVEGLAGQLSFLAPVLQVVLGVMHLLAAVFGTVWLTIHALVGAVWALASSLAALATGDLKGAKAAWENYAASINNTAGGVSAAVNGIGTAMKAVGAASKLNTPIFEAMEKARKNMIQTQDQMVREGPPAGMGMTGPTGYGPSGPNMQPVGMNMPPPPPVNNTVVVQMSPEAWQSWFQTQYGSVQKTGQTAQRIGAQPATGGGWGTKISGAMGSAFGPQQ
jgi:TP901 family phage tail tape measure protein